MAPPPLSIAKLLQPLLLLPLWLAQQVTGARARTQTTCDFHSVQREGRERIGADGRRRKIAYPKLGQ